MKWILGFALMIVLSSYAFSQLNSLETPSDSRMVALGNSLVSDNLGINSIFSNPSSLAGFKGIGVHYQDRMFDYLNFLPDLRLRTIMIAIGSPIGSFAFRYARFDFGKMTFTTIENPDGIGNFNIFDYTINATYALEFNEFAFLGFTAKMFDHSHKWISGEEVEFKTTPAYLFDLGLNIRTKGFITEEVITDCFSAGIALQNFGSDREESSNRIGPEVIIEQQMPRYLRAGFAWQINVAKKTSIFRLQFTSEYRKWLNAKYEKGHTDFWGIGTETQFFEILLLRAGAEIQPYESIFGEKEKPDLRYGAGLNLSPQQIGIDIPLYLKVDYAVVPLHTVYGFFNLKKKFITAWSIGVEYKNSLF
jgi:hypothetical protein